MNQPPIDNQFVQPGCEQFISDTPKTDLACSGPPETVVARLRELSSGLERQVDRLCRERENISDFNAAWHKEMTSRNAELALKVIEVENELDSMRSKFSTMNQPAPSDTPTPRTDALINRLKHFWYMGVSCSVEIANFCKVLERELTRLSAEREGEWIKNGDLREEIEGFKDKLDSLRATLAERDRQLAEAKRALAMAIDAANKGDDARCKAGAMEAMIEDLKRQLAEVKAQLDEETNMTRRLLKGIEEKVIVRDLKDQLATSERQRKEMEGSARELVAKIKLIHGDARYHSVWICAANHGTPYTGPKYDRELERLEKSLRSTPETPTA